MATQVQYRRGTNAQNIAFTGALAEITVDTTNGTLRVHDGITAGGSNLATVSYVNAQVSSANTIVAGTSNVRVFSSGNVTTSVAGTANVLVVQSTGALITGDLSVTGNATLSGNILGDRIQNGTTVIDIESANGNANISVGGTSNIAVFANTGVYVSGLITATGNVTGGNIRTAGIVSATGTVFAGADLTLTGNIVDTSALTISTGSNGNIALAPNGTGIVTASGAISAVGNITGGNVSVGTGTVTVGNIVNSNGNGVGNIGSSSLYFNTVFAKATSAQYADLAEMYQADTDYAPGTVVEFGGDNEITVSTQSHSTRVAGIISTNPSYLMNATQAGNNVLPVALTGRVPCKVIGKINKGDRLVASDQPGVATALDKNLYEPGCIIGKALQNYNNNNTGTIEVAVGRF